jgi:hypothetical protein
VKSVVGAVQSVMVCCKISGELLRNQWRVVLNPEINLIFYKLQEMICMSEKP